MHPLWTLHAHWVGIIYCYKINISRYVSLTVSNIHFYIGALIGLLKEFIIRLIFFIFKNSVPVRFKLNYLIFQSLPYFHTEPDNPENILAAQRARPIYYRWHLCRFYGGKAINSTPRVRFVDDCTELHERRTLDIFMYIRVRFINIEQVLLANKVLNIRSPTLISLAW